MATLDLTDAREIYGVVWERAEAFRLAGLRHSEAHTQRGDPQLARTEQQRDQARMLVSELDEAIQQAGFDDADEVSISDKDAAALWTAMEKQRSAYLRALRAIPAEDAEARTMIEYHMRHTAELANELALYSRTEDAA